MKRKKQRKGIGEMEDIKSITGQELSLEDFLQEYEEEENKDVEILEEGKDEVHILSESEFRKILDLDKKGE